jgi:hypothetical protein
MNRDKKTMQDAMVVRKQLAQPDLREALRTHNKPAAYEGRFEELLARLEEAERNQNSR